MRSKICGQNLKSWVIFIGLLYLVQAIISSTLLITSLVKYKNDKEKATAAGEQYDEDREVGKMSKRTMLLLTKCSALTK